MRLRLDSAAVVPRLATNLELLWTRINEKFQTISQAFRYFDVNSNLNISYQEFYNGLDKLKVKINEEDIKRIFEYLDLDKDGQVSYNEFCNLCEERRRKIDPFEENAARNEGTMSVRA